MAFYSDEEQPWKCSRHPPITNRNHTGICPICLRDRLINLCPNCANPRPCPCCRPPSSGNTSGSTSGSNSSFYDLFPPSSSSSGHGQIGRVSNLIESEPPFGRSRSVGVHLLKSRFSGDPIISNKSIRAIPTENRIGISRFWSVFRTQKIKEEFREEDVNSQMMRSRSVYSTIAAKATPKASAMTRTTVVKSTKGWNFPSPMKVFRQHKTSKVVQEH
ncbi:uncharacterized protein LOC124942943 [Impatiens glandulifera]|uniref:uncharacterized protein LOC124942943 n=1 Tax=Impatiens glandulifera TaxID=253017 RepID=UPI001FB086E7|nr:uncharacterized protein LOC124942943 [Impatiens glandulifera]